MMNVILNNSMQYFQTQGLNPLNNYDLNTITNRLIELFPTLQSWSYDDINDTLTISYLVVVPRGVQEFGEVVQGDFIIG